MGHGKTAEKQPEKKPKHPKNSCFDCFSGVSAVFPAVFRLFYRDPLGTLFGCFQCRAFGTSVAGRRDCKQRGCKKLQNKGLMDTQSICPFKFPGMKAEGERYLPETFSREGGLYQMHRQSLNTHGGKQRSGGVQPRSPP